MSHNHNEKHGLRDLEFRTLMSLGITYPDIGTSPLYTMTLALLAMTPSMVTPQNIIGMISFVLWVPMGFVVTYWFMGVYLIFADSQERNGPAAKFRQISEAIAEKYSGNRGKMQILLGFSVFFAVANMSLFGDDVLITPSIGVLSSFEALGKLVPGLDGIAFSTLTWVALFSSITIIGMFAAQLMGTEKIALFTGPVMFSLMMFYVGFGAYQIVQGGGLNNPIMAVFNPVHAIRFVLDNFMISSTVTLIVIGELSLSATGGEAGPWDQSMFGRKAIMSGWGVVFLCSIVFYLGQGSWMLQHLDHIVAMKTAGNAHDIMVAFDVAPNKTLYAMFIVVAAAGSFFAGQAVISAIFVMFRELTEEMGWINIPTRYIRVRSKLGHDFVFVGPLNCVLLVACLFVVLFFKSSEGVGSIYGVTVTMGMLIGLAQGVLMLVVVFHHSIMRALLTVSITTCAVGLLFAANIMKLTHAHVGAVFTGIAASIWAIAIVSSILYARNKYGKSPFHFESIEAYSAAHPSHRTRYAGMNTPATLMAPADPEQDPPRD